MIDFGYSKYQVGTAGIYIGLGGFINWSYAPVAAPGGATAAYRNLMGVGL